MPENEFCSTFEKITEGGFVNQLIKKVLVHAGKLILDTCVHSKVVTRPVQDLGTYLAAYFICSCATKTSKLTYRYTANLEAITLI